MIPFPQAWAMEAEILIVDDDPDHLELSVLALGSQCAPERIATASSPAEALAVLQGQVRLPRLAVVDVKLGRYSGFDLLESIKSNAALASMPVIMHSSSRDEGDVSRSYELGASGYVVKRSDFRQLRAVLQTIVRSWRQVTARP